MSYHKSVQCDVCRELHVYESPTYVTIRGTILVGENQAMFETNQEDGKERYTTIHLCPTCLIQKVQTHFKPTQTYRDMLKEKL